MGGDLARYDALIVGCPTWNTGADELRSGTACDDVLEDTKGMDLQGKPVDVFGRGDSASYGDNFCDFIEEVPETLCAAGAKMVGYVDGQAALLVRGDLRHGAGRVDLQRHHQHREDQLRLQARRHCPVARPPRAQVPGDRRLRPL